MRLILPALSLALISASCAPGNSQATPGGAPLSNLSSSQKAAVGKQIWKNESGGTLDGLTAWNVGEEFPSLGIGHFIWYPAGFNGPFKESWPSFISYAVKSGVNPPAIARQKNAPWNSRAEFLGNFNTAEMRGLRTWLSQTVTLQTDFIIQRSRAAFGTVVNAAPASQRATIESNYRKVASTPQGTYALIDYVNFKGDGTKVSERYNGQGWGLLQVLANMNNVPSGPAAAKEFAESSKRMLGRRIKNSPPARGESRWRAGWFNRCDTYSRPL